MKKETPNFIFTASNQLLLPTEGIMKEELTLA